MLDDTREAFAAALVYLGYDINTTDEAQLNEAKDLLIKAKPGLAGYDSDTYEDLLAAGENLLAHGWNGDFLVAQEENEDIAYTMPQEGGVIWVDNICIPVTASAEKLAAEYFIDFLLRDDVGAMLSNLTTTPARMQPLKRCWAKSSPQTRLSTHRLKCWNACSSSDRWARLSLCTSACGTR